MYDGGPKESGQCPVAFSFKCVHPLCLNHTSTYFYDLSSHLEDSHSAHRTSKQFPIEADPHRQARILNSHAVAGYSAAAKSLTQRMAREPGGHC